VRTAVDTLIPDGPVNLTTPWTSQAIRLGYCTHFSIQLFFTGMPEGAWKLQCSDDAGRPNAASEPNQEQLITNWATIGGSTQLIEEAGDHTWTVQAPGYRWVRVQWTPSSGSGSLTVAQMSIKGN